MINNTKILFINQKFKKIKKYHKLNYHIKISKNLKMNNQIRELKIQLLNNKNKNIKNNKNHNHKVFKHKKNNKFKK